MEPRGPPCPGKERRDHGGGHGPPGPPPRHPRFRHRGDRGVHPEPYDESADLVALSRTPILVVSSGPKAILDLRATLERLETLGVSVVGYRTDRLPAFFSPDSPFPVPARVDTPMEAARVYLRARALGLGGCSW